VVTGQRHSLVTASANIPAMRVLSLTDEKRLFVHASPMAIIGQTLKLGRVENESSPFHKQSFRVDHVLTGNVGHRSTMSVPS
jgi:hypothetical protein